MQTTVETITRQLNPMIFFFPNNLKRNTSLNKSQGITLNISHNGITYARFWFDYNVRQGKTRNSIEHRLLKFC